MTGSLQIKNGKFHIVLNLYSANGRRKPKWIATGLPQKGNKKKAELLLRQTLQDYEKKESLVRSDMLFSDAVRQWLEESVLRVDEVTLQGYTVLATGHILPYFDIHKVKLADMNRQILQKYINEKHANGRKDGKGGLSPRTLRMHKNILHQTLNCAVRDEILPSNPCQFVILPQNQRYEASFYNQEEINTLLSLIRGEPLYPLIKLTVVYGLRRSEVLGLKWDSIDFDAKTLAIKHTVAKVTTTVEKDKTKNHSSRRSFPLLPEMEAFLLELKQREAENRKLFGKEYVSNSYILKWEDGRPFSPDYVSQGFARLLKVHNLPHIRFHELRHSCASFLINSGFSLKDVQEWLGHSNIKMTANIYGHLDVARKQSMADKLGSSFKCIG